MDSGKTKQVITLSVRVPLLGYQVAQASLACRAQAWPFLLVDTRHMPFNTYLAMLDCTKGIANGGSLQHHKSSPRGLPVP